MKMKYEINTDAAAGAAASDAASPSAPDDLAAASGAGYTSVAVHFAAESAYVAAESLPRPVPTYHRTPQAVRRLTYSSAVLSFSHSSIQAEKTSTASVKSETDPPHTEVSNLIVVVQRRAYNPFPFGSPRRKSGTALCPASASCP